MTYGGKHPRRGKSRLKEKKKLPNCGVLRDRMPHEMKKTPPNQKKRKKKTKKKKKEETQKNRSKSLNLRTTAVRLPSKVKQTESCRRG